MIEHVHTGWVRADSTPTYFGEVEYIPNRAIQCPVCGKPMNSPRQTAGTIYLECECNYATALEKKTVFRVMK